MINYVSRVYKISLQIVIFCIILSIVFVLWIPFFTTAQTKDTITKNNTVPKTTQTVSLKVVARGHISLACDDPDPNIVNNWDTTLKSYNDDVCAMLLSFGYTEESWKAKCPHQTDINCPLTY